MAKSRLIQVCFWSDPFIQSLKTDEKLLYLYLLTNERTSICGIYEITEKTICFDTEISQNKTRQILNKLSKCKKIKRYENWIYLLNFSKNQKTNPSIEQGIARSKKELPEGVFDRLSTDCPQYGLLKPKLEPKLKLEPKPKEVSKDTTTKVDYEKTQITKDINKMLLALKAKIEIESFVDSRIERNMARHCVRLMGKIGTKEFSRRLDILLNDGFTAKNCNKIKFVYNNIKGFIEPKSNILQI